MAKSKKEKSLSEQIEELVVEVKEELSGAKLKTALSILERLKNVIK